MKKDELESILGRGGKIPDLGPIENYLDAVATEEELPDFAIAVCALRIEESAPALRAVLARAADGAQLSEDEERLLFRGLYILGGRRDRETFQPLLRLLRRPFDDVDYLLGDAVTQSLSRIVAGVFDGDVAALFDVVTDTAIDEYIRETLLGAATYLTWDGRIERDRMHRFLTDFYERRLAEDEDFVWIGWLEAIALLGLRDLVPLVQHAWDEGRIIEGVMEWRHFEGDLAEAERAPDDPQRFEDASLGYIRDILEAMNWTRHLASGDDANEDYDESVGGDILNPAAPFVNPMRNVGRNDPCPCGSGKKFKKCCLAN